MTRFDVQVTKKERLLHKAFVSYIGCASEFTEPEISVVLLPNTNVVRASEEKGGSRYLGMCPGVSCIGSCFSPRFAATLPSIGDTIEALNTVFVDCSSTLRLISDLSAELSAKEHVRVDNIKEVRLHSPFFEGLLLIFLCK